MLRPFVLILLVPLAACVAARPVPPSPVETVVPAPRVDPAEPLDPAIHPLSREEEILAGQGDVSGGGQP